MRWTEYHLKLQFPADELLWDSAIHMLNKYFERKRKITRKLSLTFVPGLLSLSPPPDLGAALPEPSPSCCRERI